VHDPSENETDKLKGDADEGIPEEGEKGARRKAIYDDTALRESEGCINGRRKED
jgi:hypothetical protein